MADDDVRVPAGWYPDPLGLPQLRWWDNHAWTEHTSDARQPMVSETVTVTSPLLAYADDDDDDRRQPVQPRRRPQRRRPDPSRAPRARAPGDRQRRHPRRDRRRARLRRPAPLPRGPGRDRGLRRGAVAGAKFAESHILDDAPTSGAYDLGVRYDDLLGDSLGATSTPALRVRARQRVRHQLRPRPRTRADVLRLRGPRHHRGRRGRHRHQHGPVLGDDAHPGLHAHGRPADAALRIGDQAHDARASRCCTASRTSSASSWRSSTTASCAIAAWTAPRTGCGASSARPSTSSPVSPRRCACRARASARSSRCSRSVPCRSVPRSRRPASSSS